MTMRQNAIDPHKLRLFDALANAAGRMASRFAIPESDMDRMSVATVAGELLRRENPAQLVDLYASGYALAEHMAALIERQTPDADALARFRKLAPTLDESSDYVEAQDSLLALKSVLSSLVAGSAYPVDSGGEMKDIVTSLCRWEEQVLKLPSAEQAAAGQQRDFRQSLEASARAQGGAFAQARVVEFTSLIGGFSNLTTLFTLADDKGGRWDLVARASTGLPLGIEGRTIDGEYFLLRYLHRHGAAVAEPIWLERDIEKYDAPFLVMRKLEGENFGTVVEAQRLNPAQLRALATQLATIHAIPLDGSDPDLRQSLVDADLVGASTGEAMGAYLDRWIRLWRSTGLSSPTIEATLQWLRANLPQAAEPPVLVHGDYALHNIMMQGEDISGVLDWELSHLGGRAEDLAGLCATFSSEDDVSQFMVDYVEAGGKPVTEFQIKYCNVFRFFIMYVVMSESDLRFYSLPQAYPELLVLGSFVQLPAQRMAQAIEEAEQAKARACA